MREYGKVFTAFWSSETTRSLSEDGRMLALYLLTCQHNTILGVFRLPDGYASEDLQWTPERVSEGFRNCSSNGFATRDEASKWVVIHRYMEWNPIENPNQAKGALKALAHLPRKLALKQQVISSLTASCERFRDKLGDAFFEGLEKGSETVPKPAVGTGEGEGTEEELYPFADFWDAYPRKEGKKRAQDLWTKLQAEDQEAAISDCQTRYEGKDRSYVPHGDTYLSQRRWEDDMPPKDVGPSGGGPKNDIWKGVII